MVLSELPNITIPFKRITEMISCPHIMMHHISDARMMSWEIEDELSEIHYQ